ncbi:MAG: radical SAM protein [Actinobacteria bacterium]|nr:radical SAM protein [Actinomycetota bacterium]
MSGHPGNLDKGAHLPRLIAWEVTRFCLLSCKHCRAAAKATPYSGELNTQECFSLLDNIASFSRPIIILTGGEPMMRPDIYDIAAYGHGLGLPMVMAPCGILIDDDTAGKIVRSGIKRISISLDGATAESHDVFRGVEGAFEGTLAGLEAAKRAGLEFQINTTVSRHNLSELADIRELAIKLGARVFNPFFLVPTGRGKEMADQEISPEQYEQTLHWLAEKQNSPDIMQRVTCAPHYQRILRQMQVTGTHPVKGCMGGQSFAFVSHRGKVQICGFLELECGDLRRENLDFHKIWETSEVFQRLRDLNSYHGRCGYCEFRKVCGGCRARSYAMTGDYLAEEPYCLYHPHSRKGQEKDGHELDELDKKIISIIQADLPVVLRPFDMLADRLSESRELVLARIHRACSKGIIRRLGPVFDSSRLGYTSTLVAAKIPAQRLAEVAERVNHLPGVTHNYRREHAYNLWFTLTADSTEQIDNILDELRRGTGIDEFYSLPALAVYKIRVDFQLSETPAASRNARNTQTAGSPAQPGEPVKLHERQKQLVRLLQEGLPLVPEPFAEMAKQVDFSAKDIVQQITDWLDAGLIRRFGAVVRHQKLGFESNGMAVFEVTEDRIQAIGKEMAEYPEISHCYRRPSLDDWNYNLFAMVHGRTEAEVRRFVDCLAEQLKISKYDVLFSTTEYKKTSMKYFLEAVES